MNTEANQELLVDVFYRKQHASKLIELLWISSMPVVYVDFFNDSIKNTQENIYLDVSVVSVYCQS